MSNNTEHWEILRLRRNRKLELSDWRMLPDSGLTDAQCSAWGTYRQALRDLPANTVDPENAVWPKAPEI